MSKRSINDSILFNQFRGNMQNNRQNNKQFNNYKYNNNMQIKQGLDPKQYMMMKMKQNEQIANQRSRQGFLRSNNMVLDPENKAKHNLELLARKKEKEAEEYLKKHNRNYDDIKNEHSNNNDKLLLEKYMLLFSPKCPYSNKFIKIINDAKIDDRFKIVNIHNYRRDQLPKWLKAVPTLYMEEKDEIYVDKQIFVWLEKYIKGLVSKNTININGIELLGNISAEFGSSGCGAYYSFLDDVYTEENNNNMPSSYELINEKNENIDKKLLNFNDNININQIIGDQSTQYKPNINNNNNNSASQRQLPSISVSKPKQQYGDRMKNMMEQYRNNRVNEMEQFKLYQQRQYNRANGIN